MITGFFAFHLWLCVRYRLFTRTVQSIIQYTTLLLLFGVAAYKAVNVSFLAATLFSELSSVAFLTGKLQDLSGGCRLSIASTVTQMSLFTCIHGADKASRTGAGDQGTTSTCSSLAYVGATLT